MVYYLRKKRQQNNPTSPFSRAAKKTSTKTPETKYSKILEKNVRVNFYMVKARELGEENRIDEQIALLEEGVENFSQDDILWSRLAKALSYANRHDEALATYDHALELNPDNKKTLRLQEQAILASKRTDDVGNTSGIHYFKIR